MAPPIAPNVPGPGGKTAHGVCRFFLIIVTNPTDSLNATPDNKHGPEKGFTRAKRRGDRLGLRAGRSAMNCHQFQIVTADVSIAGTTARSFDRMPPRRAWPDLKRKEACHDG